jgi:hypothetical protein
MTLFIYNFKINNQKMAGGSWAHSSGTKLFTPEGMRAGEEKARRDAILAKKLAEKKVLEKQEAVLKEFEELAQEYVKLMYWVEIIEKDFFEDSNSYIMFKIRDKKKFKEIESKMIEMLKDKSITEEQKNDIYQQLICFSIDGKQSISIWDPAYRSHLPHIDDPIPDDVLTE